MSEPGVRRHDIAGAAGLLMVSLVLSRATGYLRQILIPSRIGFGFLTDAYFLGFQVPDLMFQLLIGGAIQSALTPTLAAGLENNGVRQAWKSVSIFLNLVLLSTLAAVTVGELSIGRLLPLIAGDRSPEVTDLAVRISRVLFPSVVFILLAGLCIGVLNAYRRFGASAWGPSLYNLGCIASLLAFGNQTAAGAVRVAAGVMLSAALYFLFQFAMARREFASNYMASLDLRDPGFRRLFRLAIPTILSGSIVQVNLMVLSAFATRMQEGVLSAMTLAITAWQLPYGIFAVGVGTAMLPSLAARHAAGDNRESRTMLTRSLRGALFLAVPSAILLFLYRDEAIRAIFQWNDRMPDPAVTLTASLLAFYCPAIVTHTIVFITNMAFYSVRRTLPPMLAGLASLAITFLGSLLFVRTTGLGPAGLALAYTISSLVSAILLGTWFARLHPECAPRRLVPFLIRLVPGGLALVLVLLAGHAVGWNPGEKAWQLLWLAVRSAAGLAAFLAVSRLMGIPEPDRILDRVRKAFQPGKSAAPDGN